MMTSEVSTEGVVETSPSTNETSGSVLLRKVWLPRLAYQLLPYFYIVSGIAAVLGTFYISEWFWVLPHYVVFSAACLHLGFAVAGKRARARDAE